MREKVLKDYALFEAWRDERQGDKTRKIKGIRKQDLVKNKITNGRRTNRHKPEKVRIWIV